MRLLKAWRNSLENRNCLRFVIRGDTETVYKHLLQCDTWPSIEEIMMATGIKSPWRVRNAVSAIKQQMRLAEGRKKYLSSSGEES